MGVTVTKGGVPSVAGLMAMGIYPKQYLPAVALQVVLASSGEAGPGTRASDSRRFDGPIPRMIADATSWVARSSPTAIVSDAESGRVRNQPAWPADAVRELVGNALIHRDLSPWALGETSLLRLDAHRLVVKNPGGLYGLNVSRLGQTGVTSARNANLVRICQYVRLPDGARTAEALATGIPTVLGALNNAGLPAPIFDDDGLRFTVVLRQRPQGSASRAIRSNTPSRVKVLLALGAGPVTVDQLEQMTTLAGANIREQLRQLRTEGLVAQEGGQGQRTTYRRAD
jgi:ATP-dependent DNA helicase RecG